MLNQDQLIAEIAQEVVARLQVQLRNPASNSPAVRTNGAAVSTGDGVFATVDDAVKAATAAQERLAHTSLEDRGRICQIIRRLCVDNASEWARIELEETGLGRVDHKIDKLKMPRDGKLKDSEIAVLTKWVEMGLPWPNSDKSITTVKKFEITD